MDQDQERDYVEERYNAEMCPACGTSPCAGGGEKGSCLKDDHIAWDRRETDPCQAGTVGCCVNHRSIDDTCEAW
jgi:hypothetical protein